MVKKVLKRRPARGRNGKPGKYSNEKIAPALFDLETDIGETNNVAAKFPAVVVRLQAIAETARADLGDSLTKRKGQNLRPAGVNVGLSEPRRVP